jgi:hypothetical protein
VGVAVGLTVQPLARYLDGLLPHPGAAISGPYVSVDLLTAEGGTAPKVFWTMRARCGSADEYRLVCDLPPKEQGRATGYRVRHADCTVKLFDGLGGTGYGEALIPRGQPYRLSPRIAGRVVGMATYSCCNGRAALPRDAVLNQAATG